MLEASGGRIAPWLLPDSNEGVKTVPGSRVCTCPPQTLSQLFSICAPSVPHFALQHFTLQA